MSIAFVHHFHAETGTVKNVCPSIKDMTIISLDGLIEVKAVQIERHSRHAKSSKPDTHHREGSKEEMKTAAIVKRSILEDQSSEVSMSGNDIVGLFLLTKLVSITLRDLFGSLPNEGRRDERSVHSRKRERHQIPQQRQPYGKDA